MTTELESALETLLPQFRKMAEREPFGVSRLVEVPVRPCPDPEPRLGHEWMPIDTLVVPMWGPLEWPAGIPRDRLVIQTETIGVRIPVRMNRFGRPVTWECVTWDWGMGDLDGRCVCVTTPPLVEVVERL